MTTEIPLVWRSEGRYGVHPVRQTNGRGGGGGVKELQNMMWGLGSYRNMLHLDTNFSLRRT